MDHETLEHLLAVQDSVISRAQVLMCGGGPHDIKRRLRRREWATIVDGIYVAHTGQPTWEQRAMAGVLHAATGLGDDGRPVGAALGGDAAMRTALGSGWRRHKSGAPITVCIGHHRTMKPLAGFRFVRTSGLDDRADWVRTPPRLRPADAALDLALEADDVLDAVGVLADACQSRSVGAAEIQAVLGRRSRVFGRQQLSDILADIAGGTCSVLEHLFLTRVIRAHGIPDPSRQVTRTVSEKGGKRREYRDAEWEEWGFVTELDGRLFHDNAQQRDVDLDRDLDDAVAGKVAVRLGWGQVTRRACRTAQRVGILLRARGWPGRVRPCPHCDD